ncbi:MAG: prolyl oligopeptidase family serine peptidase, partial [Ferruginibacter sp.]
TAQQKKPLDHTLYDGWKSVGERQISNDGKFIVYAINPQEGDGELIIEKFEDSRYHKVIPRGNAAVITDDSKYVIFKIKPVFQETRQAKIKKKKADEMVKDSIGILELGTDSVIRVSRIKSFKAPEKAGGWVAYQLEKALPDTTKKKAVIDSAKIKIDALVKVADSVIRKSIDSIKGNIAKEEVIKAAEKASKEILKKAMDELDMIAADAEGDEPGGAGASSASDLVLRRLSDNRLTTFKTINEYYFDKQGQHLLLETAKNPKDSNSKSLVIVYHLKTDKADTIFRKCNDCKNYVFDEAGNQLAFVVESDSTEKALQKFYRLWYYSTAKDSAEILADRNTQGIRNGFTVSENRAPVFSKNGQNLFFGQAIIQAPKDTNLVDFELARLDIWHYNDDYLQPQQLKQLDNELKRSYLSVTVPGSNKVIQLADENIETVNLIDEGNAPFVLASSNKGNRIEAQWTGRAKQTAYLINTNDGSKKLIKKDQQSFFQASPKGKFIYWYDPVVKQYFTYNTSTDSIKNITQKITVPLFDTENDVPDYPSAAGFTGWMMNDNALLINDEFDVWMVDPTGSKLPVNITNGVGRKSKESFDYIQLDQEKRYFNTNDTLLFRSLNKETKFAGFYKLIIGDNAGFKNIMSGPFTFPSLTKAKNTERYLVQRANPAQNELYSTEDLKNLTPLTDIAIQQKPYVWYTTELMKWKMFDGKMSEGILYKPDNFDPKKKYPIIFYFYERNSDNLYRYITPAPSASTVNIAYFTSNGYLVFDPNIYYKTGEPGQSAYNSIVSAAKTLAKMPWVDSTRMALQGQSWGGYQIAYLVTRTNMFRAAGAGAPVANMTSAYGGIRWGTGLNRQFQYEKTQSRIGATLWQRQDLYLKNSPLFYADKVNTPLLIMHNDADDAVPWYQGIEYFTALRRLGKKVWMLQYNNEAHNLMERKNRKDLSIRLGQFFDYYLKDAKPAKWITEGLPAIYKGKKWGTEVE